MATGTNYPSELDSVPNKVNGQRISILETNRQMSAIEQLEQKVGITGSTDVNSHEYKLGFILGSDLTSIYRIVPNLVDAYTGQVLVTLPSAVGRTSAEYLYKKIDSSENAVVFATTSGQTIDGSNECPPLTAQNEVVRFISDNANWFISGRM